MGEKLKRWGVAVLRNLRQKQTWVAIAALYALIQPEAAGQAGDIAAIGSAVAGVFMPDELE
ncbi:hypothetical protein ACTSKR_09480 [Chitinibacteraceae bacterium HSL-7]